MDSSSGDSGFCPATGVYRSLFLNRDSFPLPVDCTSTSLAHFLLLSHPPPPPSKPAFVDSATGDTITYAGLRSLVAAAAAALSDTGIHPGDVALLVAPNSIHFPVVALAVLSLGAVLSTANPLLATPELQAQVDDSNPFIVIAAEELASKVNSLVPARRLILIEPFFDTISARAAEALPLPEPAAETGSNESATLLYSSGTTGKSKGVVSSHLNLVTMARDLRDVWAADGALGDEVYGCTVPLFHMFGLSFFLCGAIVAGATTVVIRRGRRYEAEDVLAAIERHRVTRIPAVPPMVVQMARSRQVTEKYDLTSLKEVICSGAPIGREHMERFADCFPEVRFSQCYGMTETSGPATVCNGVHGRIHSSIGRLIPSLEAKVVDVSSKMPLPPNQRGELCLKGSTVMQGYLKNKEATSHAIDEEGWLHTGDMCYIDSRGLIYIVDRIKELIKYKAYQVAPAELEAVLSSYTEILDVAVTSYPDDEAGEIPLACVVRKPGSKITEQDVIDFMKDKVAPYKKIRKVVFMELIPKSPSGKILRRILKDAIPHHKKPEILAKI